MIKIDSAQPEMWSFFFFNISKPAAYITHSATFPLSDTGGKLSDYI